MIDGLKPYPKYKDSGSRWLGTVPASWEVRNLRTLIGKRTERERPDLPLLSVAREKGVFVRSLTDEDENHNVIPEDLSNYKVARAGNLVINKMKAWQGSMGIAPCDGIVSPAYFVFDFQIANHRFGQTLLRSKPYVAHFGQASDGVRVGQWDLSITGMRQIPILIPHADEQDAIVRFLDHANGRIERAIRAKQKLMALLNEQKQAIIHRAVTRGLNPNVPLKPSGIPWLGDIPKHWEVRRLKTLFQNVNEQTKAKRQNEIYVALEHVQSWTGHFLLPEEETKFDSQVKRFRKNDVLFGKLRPYLAKVARPQFDGICVGEFLVLRPIQTKVLPSFIEIKLRSKQLIDLINTSTVGAKMPRADWAFVGGIAIAHPPDELEQEAIVDYVLEKAQALHTVVTRTEREIGLLREYRTRLVADVVTGKLDVRAAARHLPAESAEPETAIAAEDLPAEVELEPEATE